MTRLTGGRRLLVSSAAIIAGLTVGLLPSAPSSASPAQSSASPAQSSASPATSAPRTGNTAQTPPLGGAPGALTGTLLGGTGAPLPGACVTATGQRAERTVPALTSTGRYHINGLPPGAYTVSFADCARPGEYLREWYVHQRSEGSDTAGQAQRIEVLPGRIVRLSAVSLRPVSLRPASLRTVSPELAIAAEGHGLRVHPASAARVTATITGTVLGPRGHPLRGICALAWMRTAGGGMTAPATPTLRNGHYKVGLAPRGRHVIKITMQFTTGCGNTGNYAPQWWKHTGSESKATTLSVRAGTHLTGIDARLPVGGVVGGTVRAGSAHGKRLGGICVEAFGPGAAQAVFARTKANGSYRMTALGTGRYQLSFSPGCGNNGNYLTRTMQSVHVTVGKTTRVSVFLHLGGTIDGMVTASAGSHAPISGICVTAAWSSYGSYSTMTAANGTYSMGQLPPGRYQISFAGGCGNKGSYAPQYYPARRSTQGATRIRIAYGQTVTGVDASMAPGATITGDVTNRAGHGLRDVCPVVSTPQQLSGIGPAASLQGVIPGSGFGLNPTSATGKYRLPNLAPGLYYVQFVTCGDANLAPAWYKTAPQFTTASLVSADAGLMTTGIDALMRTGATLTGTVRGSDGKLLANSCELAFDPAAPPLLSDAAEAFSAHGQYRLTGLAPGSYQVEASPCDNDKYATEWYRGKNSPDTASLLTVRAGEVTTGIDFTLHAGGSVSGMVTGASGEPLPPLPNVCVFLDSRRGVLVDTAFTGSLGRYRLAAEPPGTYTVTFTDCYAPSAELAPVTKTGVRIRVSRPVRGLDAVLRPGGSISGTVLAGVEGGGPPGPAAGVCVVATPAAGGGLDSVAVAGQGGRYHLSGLAAGKYRLLFTDDCAGATPLALAPQLYPAVVRASLGVSTTGVDATLQADGQITGTVLGPGAKPLAGICVTAQPRARGPQVVAVTTSTGSYSIGSLLPGRYRVKFSSGCGTTGYTTQWFSDAPSPAAATQVTVKPGVPTAGIDGDLTS